MSSRKVYKQIEQKVYFRLTENNVQENEVWNFYIEIGYKDKIIDLVKEYQSHYENQYPFPLDNFPYSTDDLVYYYSSITFLIGKDKQHNSGYLNRHNIITGKLNLQKLSEFTKQYNDYESKKSDPLKKGGILELFE